MSCTICVGAMPEVEWCRCCGEGLPETPEPVEPMTGLRYAIRVAHGGPLSSDGQRESEAFYAAWRENNAR